MNMKEFFPPDAKIRCIPDKINPRVLLMGSTLKNRWKESALFPGFRQTARIYRLMMRLKVTIGIGDTIVNDAQQSLVKGFVSDLFPDLCSMVGLIGTSGPTQKLTIELWDKHRVIGYFKFAEKPAARLRLQQEQNILTSLPERLGPKSLKFGNLQEGLALVTTPLVGQRVFPSVAPPQKVLQLIRSFPQSKPQPMEQHPGCQMFSQTYGGEVEHWLRALADREWPVVFQHGDFAPWNLIQTSTGMINAIDWEYGNKEQLPFLDLAYYILQVGFFIFHWPASNAKDYAIKTLSKTFGLTYKEAKAFVCLAMFQAFQEARKDGINSDAPLQLWRQAIWQDKA